MMATMDQSRIQELKSAALHEIAQAKNVKDLEEARVKYLGRERGVLTALLKKLKDLSAEDKKKFGPILNSLRDELEAALKNKLEKFKAASLRRSVDVTMPGEKIKIGHLHPLTLIENKIKEIFAELNFSVVEGPEIESERYNFDSLNIPANHPARDMWDTFWLRQKVTTADNNNDNQKRERLLMRTHTSPMQIRYMETHEPPFQIIVPGRVFRFEAIDASHEINFHQVEGLMVGPNVTLANFKYIISEFFNKFFGQKIEMRFRPSYFPFVEPGLEVDVKLGDRWLEVMGAGMVHQAVFDAVKYNPKQVRGFAFGLGLERVAMIKYGIPDIRMFYDGDLRFLNQF
jgi:phenylalanyl-tRNA synthetase alpha chain